MGNPTFIEAQIRTTPSGSRESQAVARMLPDDMCEESTRRLRAATLVWAGLWAIGLVLNNLVAPHLDLPMMSAIKWEGPANFVASAYIALSLGLYWCIGHRWCPARLAVDVGLIYEVALAFGVGIVNQWDPRILAGRISWLCVLILIFPMIVPNTPKKTFIAAFLAASMDPVGIAFAAHRGLEVPSLTLILWAYLPNYVCALLAVIPAHIISKMGRQMSKARELGSYQLGELLGSGGMGEVYRAKHRLLARPAAVKLIKAEALGASGEENARLVRQRFRREAEAAAALHSPHTIDLYDFGVTTDGSFYYVMELLEGMDLERLIRRFGPMPPERVIYLLQQACHSLADAHAHDLIHRDIKPANIHACRMGLDLDFIKVLDFGLVKSVMPGAQEQTLMTSPGVTTGTPAYMAPEMALGSGPVDRRVDLYALGCVAYWLLTGQLVFEADGPLQMVARHLQAKPVPPSQRTELEIPPALDELILQCLEKDPERRPADALEIASRLGAVQPAKRWDQERARRWWQVHLPHTGATVPESATLDLTSIPGFYTA